MQQYTTDIMIIGGGASGLAAAVAAKRFCPELSVTILERNSRVGKKILATGNGRCNLGNISTDSRYYYGSCKKYWNTIIEQTQPAEAFFQSMGLYCRRESDGRLYPCSNQAASVLDALRLTIEQEGISDVCDCLVSDIQQTESGILAKTTQGDFLASAAIVTTGGFAAPKTGSDGSAFSWLLNLGHHCNAPKPALVHFLTKPVLLRLLKGIRLSAEVTAISENGTVLAVDTGEVQFTERTISGICVMNLSAACVGQEPAAICLRLLPEIPEQRLLPLLWELYGVRTNWKLEDWLTGLLPKKAGIQLLRSAGIAMSMDTPVYEITPQQLEQVVKTILTWKFPVFSRGSWQEAQVTSGGIPAEEIDADLQSHLVNSLFFAGEILDFHGNCGRYNLNWAWQSGQFSGENAAKQILQKRGDTV